MIRFAVWQKWPSTPAAGIRPPPLAQTPARAGGHGPGRSDRWTVPGRHPSIKSELAEPGHRGASQDILVERLSRGRPRLRVRIRCVQRALRRSTHRIPCWRPRPSHTRPTPTSRASVLPEVTTAGSRRRQAASELESRHANRLSHQTLRNSRSLESSRGVERNSTSTTSTSTTSTTHLDPLSARLPWGFRGCREPRGVSP